MAKLERLNKRVKKIEEWMQENEEMGGPKGYLDTMVSLYQDAATSQRQAQMVNENFNRLKTLNNEFLSSKELGDEWNTFLEEKDAVQKQQAEEVSVQEQAKGSEETSEAPKEEKE